MATGYEQVRSIAAYLADDLQAANDVRLVLPETGVCSVTPSVADLANVCCGGSAPAGSDACCLDDHAAREARASKAEPMEAATPMANTSCCT
jgi:hypothetical protein